MLFEPRCFMRRCKHLDVVYKDLELGEISETLVCVAFPEGIPVDIAYGQDPHTSVHPEQVGDTVYEPESGAGASR